MNLNGMKTGKEYELNVNVGGVERKLSGKLNGLSDSHLVLNRENGNLLVPLGNVSSYSEVN